MTRRILINGSQRDVVSMTFAGLSLSDDDTLKFAKSIKAIDFNDLVVSTIPRGINGTALPHGVGTYSTATTLATSMNGWVIHRCGADIFDFGFCYAGDDGKLHHVEWIGASLKGIGEKANPSQGLVTAPSAHINTFQTRYLFRDGVCMTVTDEVPGTRAIKSGVKVVSFRWAGDRQWQDWLQNAVTGGKINMICMNGSDVKESGHFNSPRSVAATVVYLLGGGSLTASNVRAAMDDPRCPAWFLDLCGTDLDAAAENLVKAAEKWVLSPSSTR